MKRIIKGIGISLLLIVALCSWVIYDNISTYRTPAWVTETLLQKEFEYAFESIERIDRASGDTAIDEIQDEVNAALMKDPKGIHSIDLDYSSASKKGLVLFLDFGKGIVGKYSERFSFIDYGDQKFEKLVGHVVDGSEHEILRYRMEVNGKNVKAVTFEFYYEQLL